MLNIFCSDNVVLVRNEQDRYAQAAIYQTRTKTMAKGLIKRVEQYKKDNKITSEILDISEPKQGLKTKNWYVRVIKHKLLDI